MAVLTIIAGPNGAGKSTFSQSVSFDGKQLLIDADLIAHSLNPTDPAAAAIAAGREVRRRIETYLAAGVDFAAETTLSGAGSLRLMARAKSRGYEVRLVFLGLESAERCISRVRNRVRRGGHSIPDDDVRRRFARSMARAAEAAKVADFTVFYDNSAGSARPVLIAKSGAIIWQASPLPAWVPI